jgi:hypothetical protein
MLSKQEVLDYNKKDWKKEEDRSSTIILRCCIESLEINLMRSVLDPANHLRYKYFPFHVRFYDINVHEFGFGYLPASHLKLRNIFSCPTISQSSSDRVQYRQLKALNKLFLQINSETWMKCHRVPRESPTRNRTGILVAAPQFSRIPAHDRHTIRYY